MRLAEKPMLRSYHALDYDWTPLSRNPCWLSNAVYRPCCYVRRNRLCLISSVGYHSTNDYYQLLLMLNSEGDKSFVDDLVSSGYCKYERYLCISRYWGLSLVSMICSSLFSKMLLRGWAYLTGSCRLDKLNWANDVAVLTSTDGVMPPGWIAACKLSVAGLKYFREG